MLSEEDKQRIDEEETYRQETRRRLDAPPKKSTGSWGCLMLMVVVFGVFFAFERRTEVSDFPSPQDVDAEIRDKFKKLEQKGILPKDDGKLASSPDMRGYRGVVAGSDIDFDKTAYFEVVAGQKTVRCYYTFGSAPPRGSYVTIMGQSEFTGRSRDYLRRCVVTGE
jgi:hypothetical protein